MGKKGSDAAREAADMVLVDDNFATIAKAVREGRTVDDNLRKALRYVLPTNAGEALLLIGAILLGMTLPITAVQIIWINFVTEVTLSLSLAFEPRSAGAMRRPPRDRRDGLVGRRDLVRIASVAVLMAIAAGGLFAFALADGRSLDEARSLAVNSVVAAEIGYLLAVATVWRWPRRGGRGSERTINLVALAMVAAVAAIQLVVTQWPPVADALGLSPLGVGDWLLIALSGAAVAIVAEAVEFLTTDHRQRKAKSAAVDSDQRQPAR
jgi:magnesium-transporting ATPase (P-type)